MAQKILIVYPHNFFQRKMGIDSRFYELIRYFKTRHMEVDLFALKNFVSSWEDQNPHENNLINQLFLYDFAQGYASQRQKKPPKSSLMFDSLPDYAFKGMKKEFASILAKNKYDFILISYIYWANLLLTPVLKNTPVILDLSDFTTLNLFDMAAGNINLARIIQDEIRLINRFDTVMCISAEEKWFFSQFSQKPVYYYVPHFLPAHPPLAHQEKEYDLLFIGSDNPFNIKGILWFFDHIYPQLDPALNILLVGKIVTHAPSFPNVTLVPFVENLSDIYQKSKVALCPLLGGTGIKIKVIEALSFGLPVVTTSKGVTGFPVKENTGCLVTDLSHSFSDYIRQLLADHDFYDRQSHLATAFFLENFQASVVYNTLDTIFLSKP